MRVYVFVGRVIILKARCGIFGYRKKHQQTTTEILEENRWAF